VKEEKEQAIMTSDKQAEGAAAKSRQIPLMSILIVFAGMLFALVVWTVPSVIMLASVGPLPTLWQVESNQRAIIALIIRIGSPLLIGLFLSACIWLWYLVKPFIVQPTRAPHHMHRPPDASKRTARRLQTEQVQTPVHDGRQERYSQPNPVPLFPPTLGNREPPRPNRSEHGTQQKKGSSRAALLRQRRQQRFYGNRTVIDHSTTRSAVPIEKPTETPLQEQEEQLPYRVVLTLLKRVTMTITTARGMSREVPLSLNAKRVQLLAYVAWLQGQSVNRDRMLEHVFGHGREDSDATREKLGEAFDSHKKLIRSDLRGAINQLNIEAGFQLIPPDLDIFDHKQRLYRLADVCQVIDLSAIERSYQIIDSARKEGHLVDQIPDFVKQACDQLISAYTGDFLGDLVTNYLDDFEPWTSSWARKPYTLFRDYYLQALWYAAEYEQNRGQKSADAQNQREQRKHWDLAAGFYKTYAMYAANSRFDTKVTFGGGSRSHGERVVMSERALRRALVLYGAIGATHQVDQVYSAYFKQMRSVSAKAWEPSAETLNDLRSAKQQTGAYRFPKQGMSHGSLFQIDVTQSA